MTDGQLMEIARRMDKHRTAIDLLIDEIRYSDHPNAEEAAEDLVQQCSFPAWPEHVVMQYLSKRDQWDYKRHGDEGFYGRPYHIGAKEASKTRKQKERKKHDRNMD